MKQVWLGNVLLFINASGENNCCWSKPSIPLSVGCYPAKIGKSGKELGVSLARIAASPAEQNHKFWVFANMLQQTILTASRRCYSISRYSLLCSTILSTGQVTQFVRNCTFVSTLCYFLGFVLDLQASQRILLPLEDHHTPRAMPLAMC